MRDFKSQLQDAKGASGPGGVKKCEKCGKPLKDPKFRLCFSCNQEARGAVQDGEGGGLAPDYLRDGYFDEKGNLKERYIAKGGDADLIAKQLA